MNIDFFEEFPDQNMYDKLSYIDFGCTIYVAAHSIQEYQDIQNKIQTQAPHIEVGYWPILKDSYWVSPFANTQELQKLYQEISTHTQQKLKILIDLEYTGAMIRKNYRSFFKNKNIIKKIFANADEFKIEIKTAEYAISNIYIEKKLELLGVSYPLKKYKHTKIIMFYSSMIKNEKTQEKIKHHIIKKSQQNKEDIAVGLGAIAKGILGNEPILSTEKLDTDLSFCQKHNIPNVVLFRVGGLNQEYAEILKKYSVSKTTQKASV
jgi:hypothetical protein